MSLQKKEFVLSCEIGDPLNPATWSGTPSKIIAACESQGAIVHGINAHVTPVQQKIARVFHLLTGSRLDPQYGSLGRTFRASNAARQIKKTGCNKILHMCSGDLPITWGQDRLEHYLYIDITLDLWMKNAQSAKMFSRRDRATAERIERLAFSQIKHFFPIGQYLRVNLIEHYGIDPGRITPAATGCGDITPYTGEKNYSNGEILIVTKSRFEDKGGALVLEAFKIAVAKNPTLRLTIVGPKSLEERTSGIPNVTVTGFISWDELQRLFNTASLFAMPAPNEAWGLVYLEALSCRIPLLGLKKYALPEFLNGGANGFLAESSAPQKIAELILDAFSQPQRLAAKGEAGQKFCLKNYTWENTGRIIMEKMFA